MTTKDVFVGLADGIATAIPYSYEKKHNMNFHYWSNNGAFGNIQILELKKRSRKCVPNLEESLFPISRPHQIEFGFPFPLQNGNGSAYFRILVSAAPCWPLQILCGGNCGDVVAPREIRVTVREIDRRMLLVDLAAEVGLITCVWSPIGQATRHSTPVIGVTRVYSTPFQTSR